MCVEEKEHWERIWKQKPRTKARAKKKTIHNEQKPKYNIKKSVC